MNKAIIPVELSEGLMQDAVHRAAKAGVSVSAWIEEMVADRVRDEAVTERFLARRARGGDAAEMLALLEKAPDMPPVPGDELDA